MILIEDEFKETHGVSNSNHTSSNPVLLALRLKHRNKGWKLAQQDVLVFVSDFTSFSNDRFNY